MQSGNFSVKSSKHSHRKHRYCPKCNESMKAVTFENSVFQRNVGLAADGIMKDYQTVYFCQNCRMKYSLDDLRKIELLDKKKEDK